MFKKILSSVVYAVILIVLAFSVKVYAAEPTTLDNLMTAFNGESNANARYLAFAKKADAEGYGQAASLFRAAARAEQVHFERHARFIKELGGTPKAEIEKIDVRSTKDNIASALAGETYEYTKMYPEFFAKAKKDNLKKIAEDFSETSSAEAIHAGLYKSALDNLTAWKAPQRDFFVCPVCGNVLETNTKSCPICNTSPKKFIAVK